MIGPVIMALLGLLTTAYGNVIVYTQTIPHSVVDEYLDMPASFGGDLPVEGLRGLLVAGVPSDGCAPLAKPPLVENFTGHWIVLVARYNCNFEVKVRNAQEAGYNCAIVHNVNASDLETMSAKDPTGIIIPSVFVSSTAGSDLLDNFLYTDGYYIMVNGDLPFNINTNLLLPFAVVVVLCLLIILIFMIVKCIKDRRRARRHRLPNRALMKIPTCKFSKGDPYETCAICLDDYQEGDKLRVLPCAHAYHSVCIDPWLTQNKRVCPVCKRRVFAAGERRRRPDSDSDSDDTEPLLPDSGERDAGAATQGGTFEQQSENPFSRAARFMARLRARRGGDGSAEVTPDPQGNVEVNDNEEINSEDTRRLIQPVVSAVSERRARRARRTRSAGHNPTSRRRGEPAAHSDSHSINTEARGQIGVAALPVVQQSSSTPTHVDL